MGVGAHGLRIGTAGWALPPDAPPADRLARRDSRLSRYARRLPATEINTTFHRHHRRATFERWAREVPAGFRFSVKVPRTITHDARLDVAAATPILERFLDEASGLGDRLGVLLVQLPPSLGFDDEVAGRFFDALRRRWDGEVACEPRHASWFEPSAAAMLVAHRIARVAADPASVPAAAEPAGWPGLVYVRLHGSPRTYYSSYEDAFLDTLASRLTSHAAGGAASVWCVFDNTAAGAAFGNAIDLGTRLDVGGAGRGD